VIDVHPDDDDIPDEGSLVATVEIHVRCDVSVEDELELTRIVWERCTRSLGGRGAGVTVSVVRE